jgi:hypothetical protein
MKYTIAAILIVAAILIIWMARTGTVQDVLFMVVAIVCVVFFASIDSLWTYLYRRQDAAAHRDGRAHAAGEQGRIVVSLKPRDSASAGVTAHEGEVPVREP